MSRPSSIVGVDSPGRDIWDFRFKYLDLHPGLPHALVRHQTEMDVRKMSPLIHEQRGRRWMVSTQNVGLSKHRTRFTSIKMYLRTRERTNYILGSCAESLPVGDVWIVRLDALYLVSTYIATETSHVCADCQTMDAKAGK